MRPKNSDDRRVSVVLSGGTTEETMTADAAAGSIPARPKSGHRRDGEQGKPQGLGAKGCERRAQAVGLPGRAGHDDGAPVERLTTHD